MLLWSFVSYAQSDTYNFRVHDGALVWQKVYVSGGRDAKALKSWAVKHNLTRVQVIDDSTLVCKLPGTRIPYKSYGFTAGNTSILIINAALSARIIIQVKDDRYRVTADHLYFDSGAPMTTGTAEETFVDKRGDLNDNFGQKCHGWLLDQWLLRCFDPAQSNYLDDDF